MSRGKGRYRTDANSKPLIQYAEAAGWHYVPLDSVIDGLLWKGGRVLAIDWKGRKTPLTARQQKLVEAGAPIHFVRSEAELRDLLVGVG